MALTARAGVSSCNDGNPCTDDFCSAVNNRCEVTNNTNSCEYAALPLLACLAAHADPGSSLGCSDGNYCTVGDVRPLIHPFSLPSLTQASTWHNV